MLRVQADGAASGYNISTTETLNGIACRYAGEAWVVGNHGTLLYTSDAGASWQSQPVPTTANLRTLATQDSGPVFIAGDGVFLTSSDTGAHWTALGDGSANFRSIAAAQAAQTVLAVSDDGALWSYENQQLVRVGSFAGARTVAVTPDGQTALLVGDNLIARSTDSGRTWSPLSVGQSVRFDDLRIDEDGAAVAVGAGGAIAHISADDSVVVQQVGTADLHTIHLAYIGADDEAVGYTAGDGGQVWITRDEGWTWSAGPNVGETLNGADQIGEFHR
jgi:photosystem II stability/assembly factor-like uncharacterized protein